MERYIDKQIDGYYMYVWLYSNLHANVLVRVDWHILEDAWVRIIWYILNIHQTLDEGNQAKKCPGGVRLEAYWSPLSHGVEI